MLAVLRRSVTWRAFGMIVCETTVILGAVFLAVWIRLGLDALSTEDNILWKALLIAAVTQLCLYFADLYDFRVLADRRELFLNAVQALGATSLILAGLYFWLPDLIVGRGVFVVAAVFVIGLVLGWRIVFEWAARRMGPRERLLLVGTSPAAVRLAKELFERK